GLAETPADQFVGVLAELLAGAAEDLRTLGRCCGSPGLLRGGGSTGGGVDIVGVGEADLGDLFAGRGVGDLRGPTVTGAPAVEMDLSRPQGFVEQGHRFSSAWSSPSRARGDTDVSHECGSDDGSQD